MNVQATWGGNSKILLFEKQVPDAKCKILLKGRETGRQAIAGYCINVEESGWYFVLSGGEKGLR